MLNHIVVALEEAGSFAEQPGCSLDCAGEIAQRTGARLSLVHVEPPETSELESLTPYRYEGVVEAGARRQYEYVSRTEHELNALGSKVAATWSVPAAGQAAPGEVRPTVERIVEEHDADLLVARFGEVSCTAGYLATLSEEVMREVRVPVLFLPAGTCILLHGLERALVPLDGSPGSEAILPLVREILPAENGSVHLLAVVPPRSALSVLRKRPDAVRSPAKAERYLAAVAGKSELAGFDVERTVLTGVDPAEAILTTAASARANFVAMTTRGQKLLGLRLGSVAHRILEDLRMPLLVWQDGSGAKTDA